MDGVPALDPLSYPGRSADEPVLLCGEQLLKLTPVPAHMGCWPVEDGATVDEALAELGRPPMARRYPVIAIGSNAAPAQLHHKLTRLGLPAVVPMTPLCVSGLGVGVSAHIGLNGYVPNSPYADPDGEARVVLTLLDRDQFQAVDDTEIPRYRKVLLPGGEFPMRLPSGEQLDAAYLYVNAAGVLAAPDGKPRSPAPQTTLLTELLEQSTLLRRFFASPRDWVTKARADQHLRATVKQIFHDAGWVLPQEPLLRNVCRPGSLLQNYESLSPLATGRARGVGCTQPLIL